MKKTLIIAILASALIGFTPKVKAATINNKVVGANKSWTIHFNHEILFDDLAKQGIVVTDNNGQKVNVTLKLGDDGKTIIVNPPDKGYEEGSSYNLIVDSKVHSKDNKIIKQQNITNFVVEKTTNAEVVTFKDANLENAVRKAANKPTGNLTKKDVENIRYLYCGGDNIKSLAGIENLTNLWVLTLDQNQISDITPLKNLKVLQLLNISGNKVSDISALAGLNSLVHLSLANNQITDIEALANLTNLETLDIKDNLIKDINPVSKMTKLYSIFISGNFFNNVEGLKQLGNLKIIDGDTNLHNCFFAYDQAGKLIKAVTKPNMSDLEKEKAIFKCLTNNITDSELKILTGNVVFCYSDIGDSLGHSKATRLLFNMIGIKCAVVKGTVGFPGEEQEHYWNMVEIGGKYYHVDTTWFDPSTDKDGNMNIYEFLNANDSLMKSNYHVWNYNEYPKCE